MPTPRASDGEKGGPNQRGSSGDLMLPSAVAHLLPTPVASEGTKPSNTMGVERRKTTGEVFLTNAIVSLCGLDPSETPLLPTPAAQEPGGTLENYHRRLKSHDGRESTFAPLSMAVQLLPSPTTTQRGTDANLDTREGARANLHNAVLLPTPTTMDSHASGGGYNGQANVTLTDATARQGMAHVPAWGDYAPAIHRWEQILGRPSPAPTMTSTKGNPQLSPRFVEWMMGLPEGWVDEVPDLTRNEKLKALGNGVVWQQAVEAVLRLLALGEVAA